jgi:hypothetical protein
MWIDFLYLYLLGFGHKLIQKGRTKVKFQNLHFLILHPILMGFFFCAKRSFYGLLEYYEKCLLFYFEKRPKFWHFAYLECKIVKQDKCQAYNGSSIVLCPTHYYVQKFTVSSKIQCQHLLLICPCWTFPCRHAVSCQALLCSPLFIIFNWKPSEQHRFIG